MRFRKPDSVEVGLPPVIDSGEPTALGLCPMLISANHGGAEIPLALDTGLLRSYLSARFATKFPGDLKDHPIENSSFQGLAHLCL
jgi:hypothetical protein